MGDALGDSLITDSPIEHIDLETLTVNHQWSARKIISTIPWTQYLNFCLVDTELTKALSLLKHVSIDVDYHAETINTQAHWIYEPDEKIAYHRILARSNFAPGSRGYWTETNSMRSLQLENKRFHNEYAYPLNTVGKPDTIGYILSRFREMGVIGLGRWGRWDHMNSDVAVAEAMQLSHELTK